MTKEIEKREPRAEVWSDFDHAFDEMRSRFFDTFGLAPFGLPFGPVAARDGTLWGRARMDVSDTGPAYRIVAEVPGIPKEKLDIRIRGTCVEIRGESATESETEGTEYVHRERTYAGFYRQLELPEPVVAHDAKAKVENGLLELELPKRNPSPTTEEVKVRVG